MPSLIGNKPNQVPTNGDLGTAAFRDQEQFYNTQQTMGFKNRIINGAMMIDQRNAGASVTPSTGTYTLDRWRSYSNNGTAFTTQQSAVAPVGFINSSLFSSTTATSVGASDYYFFQQRIEGLNVSDLAWGTANAQTITLSFQVRSSLTGQFGGALSNSSNNRSYPFSYTISSANTWEQKSITIAGDTSGTWLTTNGTGINLNFDLGCGSANIGTAGSWSGNNYYGATGDTKLVGTNGATFYITGVQLEKGSTATSFDYRPYGTELALCQRYYEKSYNTEVAVGTPSSVLGAVINYVNLNTNACTGGGLSVRFSVTKRAAPTVVSYSGTTGTSGKIRDDNTAVDVTSYVDNIGTSGCRIYATFGAQAAVNLLGQYTASAEL